MEREPAAKAQAAEATDAGVGEGRGGGAAQAAGAAAIVRIATGLSDGESASQNGAAHQRSAEPALNDVHAQYTAMRGIPFVQEKGDSNAVSPKDITQGSLGDCWLLSGMAAVARENPDQIRRLIRDNHDGTYSVTLYLPDRSTLDFSKKQARTIIIDNKLPTLAGFNTPLDAHTGNARGNIATPVNQAANAPQELWPMLLEKAFATWYGSYQVMNGGDVGAGISALQPGHVEEVEISAASADAMLMTIRLALSAHRPVTAVTMPKFSEDLTKRADELGVVAWHVYSVKSVDKDKRTISLQNPWGRQDLDELPVDDFCKFYTWYSIGWSK